MNPIQPKSNKKLGQHFLKDQSIINLITNDFAKDADCILEVGPGPAILSRSLIKHNLPFVVIEKDIRFRDILKDLLDEKNIIFTDALKINFSQTIENLDWTNKKIWLVSNLPYNISVPLFINFCKCPSISYMTLMFQKEVGIKLAPENRNKKNIMNSLMAIGENYFNIKLLSNVSNKSFSPPPKVESVVLSFTRKDDPVISLDKFNSFERYLRILFAFKRKQIKSVLKSHYNNDLINRGLYESQIDSKIRAEALNLEDIIKLYLILEGENGN